MLPFMLPHLKQHFDNRIEILERDKKFIDNKYPYYRNYELDVIIAVPSYRFEWINRKSIRVFDQSNRCTVYKKKWFDCLQEKSDFTEFFKYVKTKNYKFKEFKKTNSFIYFIFVSV